MRRGLHYHLQQARVRHWSRDSAGRGRQRQGVAQLRRERLVTQPALQALDLLLLLTRLRLPAPLSLSRLTPGASTFIRHISYPSGPSIVEKSGADVNVGS